ncbi:MAG: hypothetical protein VKJ02_07715 [Snowella sp.]|nr:hypothetical protein [Snowella sp.]
MSAIDKLQPASKADVVVYQPYYHKDKHKILPLAISLYIQGRLEGNRRIEGTDGIPFAASWYVSKLPSELTRCRIQFDGQAELSYEMTILNAEFVDYLIEVININKEFNAVDFPQSFYRKLLKFDEVAKTTAS